MGLFSKTPEEITAREASKREETKQREEAKLRAEERLRAEEFAKSPAGQARAARNAGARTFQLSLPLSQTKGVAVPIFGGVTQNTTNFKHASTIDLIEAEGWKLEHASYVYQVVGSVTSKSLLAKGLQEAVEGEIIGIYIFRVTGSEVAIKSGHEQGVLIEKREGISSDNVSAPFAWCNDCGVMIQLNEIEDDLFCPQCGARLENANHL